MDSLEQLVETARAAFAGAPSPAALENEKARFLGKAGSVTELLKGLGKLGPDEKRTQGARINAAKQAIEFLLETRRAELAEGELAARLAQQSIDVTLPGRKRSAGGIHPIMRTWMRVEEIFGSIGFDVADGPEIENDWYNFTALNNPENHPARSMQDTFYVEGGMVLRTHTSPIQVRYMETHAPPIKIIAPGRVYRVDSDATHSPMFHQVEGLVIDRTTHMGHLKGCLIEFCRAFFDVEDLPVRFRPSYFPFTEPSAEVDIGCSRAGGELKIGAGGDWLEILGSGMVHPQVLKNCGIDPAEYQGFAFGMGIERVAMLKYGIPDLRTMYDSDLRWLRHYGFLPLDIPSPVRGPLLGVTGAGGAA